MREFLTDVKEAVKEMTGEDVSNITEVLEQLGLKNEGTLKEKVHAAAKDLGVSIFVEVCDFVWASQHLLSKSHSLIQYSPPQDGV